MANRLDRRGAIIGAVLLVLFVLIGAAFLLPFQHPLTIKVDLPPAQAPSR